MKLRLLLLLSVLPLLASAQSFKPISWDIEAGFNSRRSEVCSQSRARDAAHNYYCWDCDNGWGDNVGSVRNFYIGVKPEFEIFPILTFDAGVRLTGTHSDLDYGNFIYWLTEQRGVNTHYIRVDEIRQHSAWLGVPMDLRLVPCGIDNTSVYVKCGFALNWRLWSKNYVDLYDRDGVLEDIYAGSIARQVSKPDNFNMPIWLGVGIQFGHRHAACIELTFPYFVKHAQASSLVKVDKSAFGLQFTYRIPSICNPRL